MEESQPSMLSRLAPGGRRWNWLVGAPGINEAAWCRAGIDASCINCTVFELRLFILSYGVTGRDVSLQHGPGSHGKGSFFHPATVWVAHSRRGTGVPSAGWGGKTKNQGKNKPQFSACNQPNEEMDGQAGVEKPPAATCGSSSGLDWDGWAGEVRSSKKAGVSLQLSHLFTH